MNNKPLCWVPYYSIEVNPYGGARPCCKYIGPSPYGKDYVDDFFSERLIAWRKDHFEDGKLLEGCKACQVPDNTYSFRNFSEKSYRSLGWKDPETHQLRKLTLALDNVCASSCVMCGSHFSTTIGNLLKSTDIKTYHRFVEISKEHPINSKSDFAGLENHLEDLEIVHLYGGEPLISPNFIKFMTVIKQAPKLRRITFSTGLKQIKESHLEFLKENFSHVGIFATVSLDAPLDLNEWVRGIDEEEYLEKFHLLSQYVGMSGFQTTIGSYNVFALPECVELMKTLWTNKYKQPTVMSSPIIAPEELRPGQMPDDLKKKIDQKLRSYLSSSPSYGTELINTGINLLSQPATKQWSNCLDYMHTLPKLRGNIETFDYWTEKYLSL